MADKIQTDVAFQQVISGTTQIAAWRQAIAGSARTSALRVADIIGSWEM
jgi:hypothetical protein